MCREKQPPEKEELFQLWDSVAKQAMKQDLWQALT